MGIKSCGSKGYKIYYSTKLTDCKHVYLKDDVIYSFEVAVLTALKWRTKFKSKELEGYISLKKYVGRKERTVLTMLIGEPKI